MEEWKNLIFDIVDNSKFNLKYIGNATTLNNVNHNCVSVSNLREDVVIESSAMEKQIIVENFPNSKNGFLVVAKVIEG